MATLTARPQEKLTIKHKRVLDAYFAERINDPQYEGEKDIYTVKSGDSISKIANKKGTTVSDIIANNTDITSANKHLIKVGQKINITKQTKKGDKVSFKRMDAANLGDEVYVIVKTENISGVEVCINVKQGKTDNPEVEFESKGMFIAQEGNNDISLAKATVGAYSNDSEITNKDDFANWAIFKITLGARHQEDIGEALDKLDDKKAFLFLVVDAHTRNKIDINYDGQNEDDETTFTNRWLDIKGKWFELKSNAKFPITPEQLEQIFPESAKTRREEVAKAINKYSDEFEIHNLNRMSHFLGQIGTETGELMQLKENYNYSAKTIYDIFLKKVLITHPTKTGKYTFKYHDLIEGYNATLECEYSNPTSNSQKNYGHKRDVENPIEVTKVGNNASWDYDVFKNTYSIKSSYVKSKSLFDYVYGCRMANDKKSTNDGSDYFGVGFIHLTGKEKYEALHDKWNSLYPDDKKDFMGNDISLLKTNVDTAMKASMIIWKHVQNNTNGKADKGNLDSAIKAVTKDVNGGDNGLAHRKKYTKKAYEVLE